MNTHSIYRVLPGRKTAAGSIPANLTTLSVSLIGDRFEAVAVGRGAITGTWVCPTPVTGASEFGAAIKQAVQETAFRGTTAQLVLAHPRLVSVLTSAPPVRGSSLDKVIERQAQREKPFDGEAAWCHQPTLSVKGSGTILLHLFPRALLDQFSRACEKAANLTLVAATPATAVLHGQILHLPVNTNAAILVATPGAFHLVGPYWSNSAGAWAKDLQLAPARRETTVPGAGGSARGGCPAGWLPVRGKRPNRPGRWPS